MQAFLIDKFLNKESPVSLSDSTFINVGITSNSASAAADRFKIVFRQMKALPVTITSITAINKENNNFIQWTVENESGIQQYEIEKSADGNLFTTMAVTLATANNGGSASYLETDTHPLEGYNYYRIKSVGINGQIAYSNVVKVLLENEKEKITVYPNPVANRKIFVHFNTGHSSGYYTEVTDKLGQVIYRGSVNSSGGNFEKVIALPSGTAAGTYQLRVTRANGTETLIQVIVQ